MIEMSQLSGESTTPFGRVGWVVGGTDLNDISQHTVSCGPGKDLILAFAVMLKPIRKARFSGEMLYIGISYVMIASICSLYVPTLWVNHKKRRFLAATEIDFCYETDRKVMVDLKFDALYR